MTAQISSEEVARVAGALSEAARIFVLYSASPRYADPNTVRSLRRKGILWETGLTLTPLGFQLQRHLIEQEKGG